ncbi:transposase [Nostoc punctiforme UO1]|uniref:transposase n=1 Tax=Nostoc punctiforme TaxID=272131 RepID=UPI0030A0C79F
MTVVADISEGNLIEMIDSHRSEEIIEVLMKQAIEVREQVEEVSIDMWGGFPKVIKKVFPNAEIIIDRFHVMKVVNKDLNKLRRAAGITDRQSKYLLLSNRVNLKPEQIDKLEVVLGKSECLKIAYEMKEKFREIYETNLTVKKGQKKIQEWLNHAQVFFRESASTIENHLEGICNYFLNREQVEEVSIDMWGGFPKVSKKVFPNAEIIIDRFHVMKVVNKDLNKLRRAAGITDRQTKYL